ncbi:MAG TPA: nuclear transport factor 2 family protein [Acidimicrobiales bacterium]|nr:nuclear transport factor 2 family protein [Acidimicrobiales bacterium]
MGEDEDGIRRTIAEYSQRCDDGEFDRWAELFTEDARLVFGEHATEGRAAIKAYMEQLQPPAARGKHITGSILVDVDGTTAAATTDYLFVRPSASGLELIAAGRYYDQLVRGGSRWQFSQRTITMLGLPAQVSNG